MQKRSHHETNPSVLKSAIVRQTMKRTKAQGSVSFPAIPGLVDEYIKVMSGIWTALTRAPTSTELSWFRECLEEELQKAFDESPYSKVVVSYDTNAPPQTNLEFHINIEDATMESEYADWVANREPPLFGHSPDAKVMMMARIVETYTLKDPSEIRILDVGAGTGRNTLPLMKLGYHVDAVEKSEKLGDILDGLLKEFGPTFSVYGSDCFWGRSSLLKASSYNLIVLSEVVSHFRSINELGRLFEASSHFLLPGGFLLFNVFVAKDGYTPSDLVIQASEVSWSRVFTRNEIRLASCYTSEAGLQSGFWNLESDDLVLDYERSHQDTSQWPPTGWFEHWVQGRDAFDLPAAKCPYEMHWLCYRKKS